MNSNIPQFKPLEFNNSEELEVQQLPLLLSHLSYAQANSPFYKDLDFSYRPGETLLQVLDRLPLTSKEDLAKDNDKFLAIREADVVDIVMSSGTTGTPVSMLFSEQDLQRLAYNEYNALRTSTIDRNDRVLLTCTIDRCFVAGLAYFLGMRRIGTAVIRNGHGTLQSHTFMICNQKPTAIIGVPSFLKKLASYLEKRGITPAETSVTKLICIGEPLRDTHLNPLSICTELEHVWGGKCYSTYASTETITTAAECTTQKGGHIQPELAIVEIVDADGKRVPEGVVGEVVVTPLAVEAMPLIRFKTGDLAYLTHQPCTCGNPSSRISPIVGRKKQLLKIKGTSIYPNMIFVTLAEMDLIEEYYLEVYSDETQNDAIRIHLSTSAPLSIDDIALELQARIRIKPELVIEDHKSIRKVVYNPEFRKPIRFIDKRIKRNE